MSWEYNFPRQHRLLVTLTLIVEISYGYDFDQVYTGVYFNPFVKNQDIDSGEIPLASTYTTKNLQVMLETINEKFSRITTWNAGSRNVQYQKDFTYYKQSDIQVYISEMAARINRNRHNRSITVFQGIWYFKYNPQMHTEMKLAVEIAEKANQIFPGTVEGFEFVHGLGEDYTRANETLHYIMELRKSFNAKINLGTVMNYALLNKYKQKELAQNEMQVIRKILQDSDFVTCSYEADDKDKNEGADIAFGAVAKKLLEMREHLRQDFTADELEFNAQIKWDSAGHHPWDNVKDMELYWKLANEWASKHRFPIRYLAAFDVPTNTYLANKGWWKLTDNSKCDQRSGYVEKNSEIGAVTTSSPENNNSPTNVIVGIALPSAGVAIILLLILVFFLLRRVRNLRQKLSKKDIRLFREGISDETTTLRESNSMDRAVRLPYQISFEIPRDQLRIQYDKILGAGEFGVVFKAEIASSSMDCEVVALKMAKDGSPRSALKAMLSEIKILIYLQTHPNIVSLVGAYTAELQQGIVYIATEFCSLGSLKSFLRNSDKLPIFLDNHEPIESNSTNLEYLNVSRDCISFRQMIQWSLEIACGMKYLGSRYVIHADLATRNVLLTAEKTAKISDFGLSRRMYNYTKYVKSGQEPMPWRWMAVESLKNNEFSVKSDVWSYGVTLWEIFTLGNVPYPGLNWTIEFTNMLDDGLRLNRPKYATAEIYELMVDCWNPEIYERPSFATILKTIKNIVV